MKNYQNVIINSNTYFEMRLDGQEGKEKREKIRSYVYFYHKIQL
jgi:hypothetical protein